MFIGRKSELSNLNQRYEKNQFEFDCIYGRRRVGKTELIKEFIKDKKAIFYTGLNDTYATNLSSFSSAVYNALYSTENTDVVYKDFEEIFRVVHEAASREKLILVIDEFPYIAKKFGGILSLLQRDIDHKFSKTNLFLILCGSSASFMENQVLSEKSPLFGRRTGQHKLLPFNYYEAAAFFPGFSDEEKAIAFAVCGGMPKYLKLFNDEYSIEKNLADIFFTPESVLYEEAYNLLNQEVNEPALYNAVITAIATGSSNFNKIADKAHIENSLCAQYIKALIDMGIVKKEIPFGEKETSRKTIYRLNDGMFRFWYRFIHKNRSLIELRRGDIVFSKTKPFISDFMGEAFEQICKDYMWKVNDGTTLPIEFRDIGRWWGNNPIKKCEQEIDLIAVDWDDKKAIFCECEWTNELVPESVINGLIDKASMFNFEDKYYFIFSKSGFTEAAIKRGSDSDRIRLIVFKDM